MTVGCGLSAPVPGRCSTVAAVGLAAIGAAAFGDLPEGDLPEGDSAGDVLDVREQPGAQPWLNTLIDATTTTRMSGPRSTAIEPGGRVTDKT